MCVESHETILLRKALTVREEREQFQHFIRAQAAEGTCPAKQVDFWLEVQRYKVSTTGLTGYEDLTGGCCYIL